MANTPRPSPGGRPTNAAIAAEWRAQVVSPLAWAKAKNQAGSLPGECGGYFVTADVLGRRAYLKPIAVLKDHSERAVAAREKIASDLAHDLLLPVPPAVLVAHPGTPPLPGGAVVSLVMYPVQWAWEQVRYSTPSDDWTRAALERVFAESAAELLVFDTWVGQSDHGDHPHNIVWGYHPNDLADTKLIYLDYARSLGCETLWDRDAWEDVLEAPFPRRLRQTVKDEAISAAIARIEELQEASIRDVVERIPDEYLAHVQKDAITKGLLGRRGILRAALI